MSTVPDQTTAVTMLLGPVMSDVMLDIGETHVYSRAAMNAGGYRRLVLKQPESVTSVHLDITGRSVLIPAAIAVLDQTMNVTSSVDPALLAVTLDITEINVQTPVAVSVEDQTRPVIAILETARIVLLASPE